MTTYPYKKLPTKVTQYLNGEIVDLAELSLPAKPTFKKHDFGGYLIGLSSIGVLIVLSIFGFTYWIVYLLLTFLAFGAISSSFSFNRNARIENKGLKNRYEGEVNRIKTENHKRSKQKNELQLNKKTEDYIKEKIKEELSNYSKPELISWHTKKGLSESYFIKFLFEYFKKNIKPFTKLYDNTSFYNSYQPDFVFKNDKICIDIEVDEPYVMDGRKPIHLLDETEDEYRDSFFIKNNWCVIRFSEEQTLMSPYECCKYIAHLIYELTGDDLYLKSFSFRNFPKTTNKWTRDEAEKMSLEKYRELLFLKANHQASQLEYFPVNYFNDQNILITKTGEWKGDYHLCLNNNYAGPKTIACKKIIFPALTYGETIELDLEKFVIENDYILHIIPSSINDDTSYESYKEYKEPIARIDQIKK